MSALIYRIRYAWTLWRGSQGTMSLWFALNYPRPEWTTDGDPVEDAEAELDCWGYDTAERRKKMRRS